MGRFGGKFPTQSLAGEYWLAILSTSLRVSLCVLWETDLTAIVSGRSARFKVPITNSHILNGFPVQPDTS